MKFTISAILLLVAAYLFYLGMGEMFITEEVAEQREREAVKLAAAPYVWQGNRIEELEIQNYTLKAELKRLGGEK